MADSAIVGPDRARDAGLRQQSVADEAAQGSIAVRRRGPLSRLTAGGASR